jgi:hypothetical protein
MCTASPYNTSGWNQLFRSRIITAFATVHPGYPMFITIVELVYCKHSFRSYPKLYTRRARRSGQIALHTVLPPVSAVSHAHHAPPHDFAFLAPFFSLSALFVSQSSTIITRSAFLLLPFRPISVQSAPSYYSQVGGQCAWGAIDVL